MNKETDNITVGESALRVVVGEKIDGLDILEVECIHYQSIEYMERTDIAIMFYSEAIDKTLSTPLPDVNTCVEVAVEKLSNVLYCETDMDLTTCTILAKAIADSKTILKWRSV